MIIWIAKDKGIDEVSDVFTEMPDRYELIDGDIYYAQNNNDLLNLESKIIEALPKELKPGECIKYRIELKRIP